MKRWNKTIRWMMAGGVVLLFGVQALIAINEPNCSKPKITSEPKSQTVCVGQTASFHVTATGAESYQWSKFTPGVIGSDIYISGATSPTLTLNNVTTSDAVGYNVEVANSCKMLRSGPVFLDVASAPPLITSQPGDQLHVHIGESASFTVTASNGSSYYPSRYQWRKNGSIIYRASATSKTLTLSNVTRNDQALYDVVVSNACGSVDSSQVRLTVDPAVFYVTTGGPGCSIELSGSDVGADYELVMLNPVSTRLVQVEHGTGGPLSFVPCLGGHCLKPGEYIVMAGWADTYHCKDWCGYEAMLGDPEVVGVDSLTATCSTSNSTALHWSLSNLYGTPSFITDFKIKRSTTKGGPYTVIGTAGPDDRDYVDTTIVPEVTYYYVVTIQSETCESPPSDEDYNTCTAVCSKPSYEPAYWNDHGVIECCNNCYNYGNNVQSDTYAQPGYASGTWCTNKACINNTNNIYQYAVNDGLVPSSKAAVCPDGKTKVALAIWPDHDYHWYRQDANGLWTQKMGEDPATNVDNSGIIITNPETADRGPYTNFVGYLCTCSDSVQGKGHATIAGPDSGCDPSWCGWW
jgi:hypothetical protein